MKKREPLRSIAVLPSVITLMNGFFGFLAIMITCNEPNLRWQLPLLKIRDFSYPEIAALLIIAGMLADMFDGKVARSAGATSLFGAQLDSLCDAVSFGIAPALISYKMIAIELSELRTGGFFYTNITQNWVLFSAIIYAMCALVRLARFNVENDSDTSAHTTFAGLPSPAAAGLIISLVLFHEGFIPQTASRFQFLLPIADKLGLVSLWSIPIALCAAGLLMVSRINYPHVANRLNRGTQSFGYLIIAIIAGLFAIWLFHIALFLGFTAYIIYGLTRRLTEKSKRG